MQLVESVAYCHVQPLTRIANVSSNPGSPLLRGLARVLRRVGRVHAGCSDDGGCRGEVLRRVGREKALLERPRFALLRAQHVAALLRVAVAEAQKALTAANHERALHKVVFAASLGAYGASEQQTAHPRGLAFALGAAVVRAAPCAEPLQLLHAVETQALCVVGGGAQVAADELAAVPAGHAVPFVLVVATCDLLASLDSNPVRDFVLETHPL
mmetsp:Transcript_29849/g.75093  ORF Transcript_29849/g.75093 Transcript_29849/m.75093 type:complete len:213 (-) Transcript_29849:2376-3014(-)